MMKIREMTGSYYGGDHRLMQISVLADANCFAGRITRDLTFAFRLNLRHPKSSKFYYFYFLAGRALPIFANSS